MLVIDAWLDLLLGSRCSACGTPGRALCAGCAGRLPTSAGLSWPTPTPAGLVPPWSAGEYADPLRRLVVDHKEHGRLALAKPLGRLLAVAALAAWAAGHRAACPPVLLLVPVPSHPAVVRQRGHDPLLRITHRAAVELRRRGAEVAVRPLLYVVARPGDQAGLGAGDRAANVAGRFRVREAAARSCPERDVLLVDDVITTGATLREAQRALEVGGVAPFAAATVAATRRRSVARSVPDPSLPIRPTGG